MTLDLDQVDWGQFKSPKLRVELRNASQSDLVINLGTMLANGKKQYPKEIVLILIDSQGKSPKTRPRRTRVYCRTLGPSDCATSCWFGIFVTSGPE